MLTRVSDDHAYPGVPEDARRGNYHDEQPVSIKVFTQQADNSGILR